VEPAAASLKYGKITSSSGFGGTRSRSPDGSSAVWRGKINYAELKGTLAMEESSGLVLRDGDEIATAESLRANGT